MRHKTQRETMERMRLLGTFIGSRRKMVMNSEKVTIIEERARVSERQRSERE
jgi:hypothetical protein